MNTAQDVYNAAKHVLETTWDPFGLLAEAERVAANELNLARQRLTGADNALAAAQN